MDRLFEAPIRRPPIAHEDAGEVGAQQRAASANPRPG